MVLSLHIRIYIVYMCIECYCTISLLVSMHSICIFVLRLSTQRLLLYYVFWLMQRMYCMHVCALVCSMPMMMMAATGGLAKGIRMCIRKQKDLTKRKKETGNNLNFNLLNACTYINYQKHANADAFADVHAYVCMQCMRNAIMVEQSASRINYQHNCELFSMTLNGLNIIGIFKMVHFHAPCSQLNSRLATETIIWNKSRVCLHIMQYSYRALWI